ncbi:MAG: TIGR00282 family metallophosphoesterase [Alkalispirochaeta sp.]
MRILYIAEIVGKPGLYTVKTLLPRLKKEKQIDFVIANGDGVTGGFGIGKNHSIYLRKLGVDVITGGDMTFFKKDMAEHIEKAYYMLRPANLPPEMPGRGWRHFTVTPAVADRSSREDHTETNTEDSPEATDSEAPVLPAEPQTPAGEAQEVRLAVISLLGQSGFERTHGSNPYTYLSNVLERLSKNSSAVLVDFHALTTAEKYTMFHHADGKVTAVLGSGQRVQTADPQVFPSGTAVICDAGRTGSQNSVGGMDPQPEIRKYLTRIPLRSEESWDQLELQGTILDLDLASGYVVGFEAIREECPAPPPEERESGPRRTGKSGGRGRNGRTGKGGSNGG